MEQPEELITYRRDKDRVTLEMSVDDDAFLLITVGFAWGAAAKKNGDPDMMAAIVHFMNRLNRMNPKYRHYAENPPQEFVTDAR